MPLSHGHESTLSGRILSMNRHLLMLLYILFSVALLSACATTKPTAKKGLCNTLKSDIVFSGATTNNRQAEIENSEEPLAQKNYDKNC